MIYYIYNWDELLGFIYNSNTYYYHKNIFGDIIGILDSNYNEVVTYTYNSWGLLTNKTDTTTINLSTINPFRYRSYYYDEETNLYYLNSRYYNPEWGRFVNGDGVIGSNGDAISQNLFAYTSNNFINYSDNDGYGLISALKKVVSTVKNIVKKTITKLKSITQSNGSKKNICTYDIASTSKNGNYTKVNIKSAKNPSVSRPKTGDPSGVYDIPNGDVRILGPEGTLPGAKDFDGSHPWRHPDLENPHVHDWDELGRRQKPRNPTAEERDWWDNHKKEVGQAAVIGGATVGTAYLIYRGIRMLPSLTPWTWWTIPYNLATP